MARHEAESDTQKMEMDNQGRQTKSNLSGSVTPTQACFLQAGHEGKTDEALRTLVMQRVSHCLADERSPNYCCFHLLRGLSQETQRSMVDAMKRHNLLFILKANCECTRYYQARPRP